MLDDGQVLRTVPNWWNPYAPNVGQKDPHKRQKAIITIKLVFVVITLLGGAILALCINVFVRDTRSDSTQPQDEPAVAPQGGHPMAPPAPDHKAPDTKPNVTEKTTTVLTLGVTTQNIKP